MNWSAIRVAAGSLLYVILFICLSYSTQGQNNQKQDTLTVALFPVPRVDQFKDVLIQAWKKLHPNIDLQFVTFDFYSADPPNYIDVFVFDGLFYKEFISRKYLQPIAASSVNNLSDFMDFAKDAVWGGDTLYGVPYLGCAHVYVYRNSDRQLTELSRNGIDDFYAVIGDAQQSAIPPIGKGVLMDLAGSTTDACLYLISAMNVRDSYSKNPVLPDANNLDSNVLNTLRLYTKMVDTPYDKHRDTKLRTKWFKEGRGRVFCGYTEHLSLLPTEYLDSVSFRILPTANTYLPFTQQFYVDIVSINSHVSMAKYPLALELLNLMTSQSVVYNSMIPTKKGESPQFLIPTRGDVLTKLMDVHPLYNTLASMIYGYYCRPMLLGPEAKTWLKNNKSTIKDIILKK